MKRNTRQILATVFLAVPLVTLFIINQGLHPALVQGRETQPSFDLSVDHYQMTVLTYTLFLPITFKPQVPNGGDKIVFSYRCICGSPGDIFTINPDGTERTNLTNHTKQNSYEPVWSPDKTKIAFASDMSRIDGGTDIYVMNADGTGVTRLTNSTTPVADRQPAWSPDGTKIAFASFGRDGDQQGGIYLMNTDGSNIVRLTTHNDGQPHWSPDGTKLAISSTRDAPPGGPKFGKIYVMNVDGSGAVAITDDGGADVYPRWSPDGTKIAFSSPNRGNDSDIYVVNADGTGFTRLTFAAPFSGHFGPAWSADGSQIAFLSRQVVGTTNEEIFTMNADGTNQQRVTVSILSEGPLDW